ncbi:type II toxin-antitoxin system death-on-curing family toxin [Actinocorallia populi]|uniref:type II toxin-antitoxin system death-on-curing family toxin n=1 Tax=Actinocorallia populi TaxID=2079200 RepID=UPI000D092473|nr:type II toxin-antitoxin system death-on-curing family toxin [Actinocorallia populi]
MIHLTAEQLIAINARHLGGTAAVRDAGLAASAAARPATVAFGEEAYPTLAEKAAALLHSVLCNHPFVDGNKRTGWAACRTFLLMNGADSELGHDEVFDLVLGTAGACSRTEIAGLARVLRVTVRRG